MERHDNVRRRQIRWQLSALHPTEIHIAPAEPVSYCPAPSDHTVGTVKPYDGNVTHAEPFRRITEGKRYIAFPAGEFDKGTVLETADLVEHPREQMLKLLNLPNS